MPRFFEVDYIEGITKDNIQKEYEIVEEAKDMKKNIFKAFLKKCTPLKRYIFYKIHGFTEDALYDRNKLIRLYAYLELDDGSVEHWGRGLHDSNKMIRMIACSKIIDISAV